jgi:hypothetical protein
VGYYAHLNHATLCANCLGSEGELVLATERDLHDIIGAVCGLPSLVAEVGLAVSGAHQVGVPANRIRNIPMLC